MDVIDLDDDPKMPDWLVDMVEQADRGMAGTGSLKVVDLNALLGDDKESPSRGTPSRSTRR